MPSQYPADRHEAVGNLTGFAIPDAFIGHVINTDHGAGMGNFAAGQLQANMIDPQFRGTEEQQISRHRGGPIRHRAPLRNLLFGIPEQRNSEAWKTDCTKPEQSIPKTLRPPH